MPSCVVGFISSYLYIHYLFQRCGCCLLSTLIIAKIMSHQRYLWCNCSELLSGWIRELSVMLLCLYLLNNITPQHLVEIYTSQSMEAHMLLVSLVLQWKCSRIHSMSWIFLFQLGFVLFGGSLVMGNEMAESESVIHSLPPSPPHHLPYSPIIYPPYNYPGYTEAIILRSPISARELEDAIRTQDGDKPVSSNSLIKVGPINKQNKCFIVWIDKVIIISASLKFLDTNHL